MRFKHLFLIAALATTSLAQAQVVHPKIGKTASSDDGRVSIELIGKKQFFAPGDKETADGDINSPKSKVPPPWCMRCTHSRS